ncbi:hypothetical protein A2Z33_04295 [Candidatus Gottesmanbacteria bacterium RBG_16_52_11]|uniref:ATP synthase F1 complex delta/epsilon subunit N-terminal domain-containing protein n=1 Tax=Candidatus Gottesmanbacteria bacterium RBG_16_52_11 TaxID=1798374 RepID=A0A1F5YVZ2_9BACT|nr:MAG: hypothetical protein A2Z33_04295 [Candidatus Gottesmanbacteria bacterium RBG_16_52_11]
MAPLTLHVRINSPEKVIWEGEAEWVSSENTAVKFDILPMHSNFISVIEKKPIRVKSGGKEESYSFDRSVIYAHKNSVLIYTHI